MNHRLAGTGRKRCAAARDWCAGGALAALLAIAGAGPALAAALDDKARESGCIGKPEVSNGMYRCQTKSGTAFFNVPGTVPVAPSARSNGKAAASTPTPAGFPRVDTATQKGRDDVRRKVLGDELASEEKLLVEARAAYADGAPSPLPEERADAEKYRQRIARLRQAVGLHEKNVEALKKEIASIR
ncbi:MAG: DUF4124 domain-containing protein [Betaproteobacteria bacterium]|nr:DUF4124 domain-containing protein [Betaproteobacteria bacterium]